MSDNDKYSLLIMRDSTQKVYRFRVSLRRIKIIAFSLAVLLLLTMAGVSFSVYSIKKYVKLTSEISELEASLANANIKLESLQNVKEILQDSEDLAFTQNKLESPSLLSTPPFTANAEQKAPPALNATAVVANVFPKAADAAQGTPEVKDSPAPVSPDKNATADLTGAATEADFVKISNLNIKARSPKTVRLAFDLNNANPGKTITGETSLALVSSKDEVLEIAVPKNDMNFHINNYKRMSTVFPLPEGIALGEIKSLRVNVISKGEIMQTELFPFPENP